MKKLTRAEDVQTMKKRCLDLLERYIYLILFNTYLHCDRYNKWQRSFSSWMTEVQRLTDCAKFICALKQTDFVCRKGSRLCIAVNETSSHSYGVSVYGITHSLSVTRHPTQVNIPP